MKTAYVYALFFGAMLICNPVAVPAQSSTPQGALEEMVTTDKFEVMRNHLPLKVVEALNSMEPARKAEVEKELLFSRKLKEGGVQLHKTDDPNVWEIVKIGRTAKTGEEDKTGTEDNTGKEEDNSPEKPREAPVRLTLKNTFTSGPDALLMIEIKEKEHTQTALIGMRLENGEWRVFSAGEMQSMESEILREAMRDRQGGEGSAAAAMLRTLNTAIVTYATTYPKTGYPASLAALSGYKDMEPDQDHAMLLDPLWMESTVIKNGYEFNYTLVDPGNVEGHEGQYRITVTPVELGKGGRSFFTDATAVIRSTKENRPANENDPPL